MLHNMIVSQSALAESEERTFPISKNRSRRIHKKLVQRFGGEFKMKPAAYHYDGRLIVHPTIYAELMKDPTIRDVARPAVSLGSLFSTPPAGAILDSMKNLRFEPIVRKPCGILTLDCT